MTTRALVLGGGGPVGVAWEAGLIAGFAQAGVDLGLADHVLGTSAGAIVGARLRLTPEITRLADAELTDERPSPPSDAGPAPDLSRLAALMEEAQSGARNPAEVRRELGAIAIAAETPPLQDFLTMIARSLGALDAPWPSRGFACTAVDVDDGGFQLWEAGSGAPLLSAVASSCAVPGIFPPAPILGRRYMDGGMRSVTNADLAAGYDVVVVVAVQPPGTPGFGPRQLDDEVESLKAGGSTVVVVTPDDAAAAAMGANLMDFGRSAAVAAAGLAQAKSQADVLAPIWRG
jgi:NTE family protein